MDQIQHSYISIRGLKLHVAEIGTGPKVVLFLHGFPEIWYTWRHQMMAVANAGFRAIAPDFRGYGLSEQPPPEKATFTDIAEDLVAILDALNIDEAFVVGKDFGIRAVYLLAVLFPARVTAVVTIGSPLAPPSPPTHHKYLPEGFYVLRWQEPGRAEADFGRFDARTVVKKIYTMFSKSEMPIAAEDQEVMDLVGESDALPSWFSEEELDAYSALYEKSGFQTALKVPYRSLHEEYNITNPRVEVPALLIVGECDYAFKFPGVEDFIKSGQVKQCVPDLEIVFLPEGTHFVHEQLPGKVNELLLSFLGKHF